MEKMNSQSELVARIKTLADDRGLRMQYLAKCLDADAGFFNNLRLCDKTLGIE